MSNGEDRQTSGDPLLFSELQEQWELSQSDFNLWVAGIALGHQPSPSEAFLHFCNNGGAEDFRRQHPPILQPIPQA